jgi:hypothetical protein
VERGWRWCRRHPGLAASLGSTAAALVLVAVLSLLYADRQARDAAQIRQLAGAKDAASRNARNEAERATKALAESNHRLSLLQFEQAHAALDRHDFTAGLLGIVEGWRTARDMDDASLRELARLNLATWSRLSPPVRLSLAPPTFSRAAFSPDGRLIAVSSGGMVTFYDTDTGRPNTPALDHRDGTVVTLAFSPDGKVLLTQWMAVTTTRNYSIRLWDVATRRPLGDPIENRNRYSDSITLKADGRSFVAVYSDILRPDARSDRRSRSPGPRAIPRRLIPPPTGDPSRSGTRTGPTGASG